MMKLVKKIFYYFKTKGVILTLIKIWDYMLYKIRKRKIKFNPITIIGDNVWLTTNPRGVNFGHQDKELTVNVGFHTSVKCIEKLHDSTQADWKFERIGQGLLIKQRFWNLPLNQVWKINLDKNKIYWSVVMDIENILILDEIRAGILVNSAYKSIKINGKKYYFPEINDWELLGIWENKSHFIIQTPSQCPDIKFSIQKSLYPANFVAQNTDRYLNGRLIQMGIFRAVELPVGKYRLAELELELLK
jgi:hypothetical protein